jgi:hypothetical protein
MGSWPSAPERLSDLLRRRAAVPELGDEVLELLLKLIDGGLGRSQFRQESLVKRHV